MLSVGLLYSCLCYVTLAEAFFFLGDDEPVLYCIKICPLYCSPRRRRDVVIAYFQVPLESGFIVTMLGSDDDILGKLKELFKFWRHAYSDFGFCLGIDASSLIYDEEPPPFTSYHHEDDAYHEYHEVIPYHFDPYYYCKPKKTTTTTTPAPTTTTTEEPTLICMICMNKCTKYPKAKKS